MVKSIRLWVIAALLVCVAAPAFAGARLETRTIPWRKYCTTTGGTNFVLLSGTAGLVDSAYVTFAAAGASTTPYSDTTATFVLPDLAMIPTQPGNTVTAVDTLYGMEATVAPVVVSGSAAAASDTCIFTMQGSFDGTNWASAPAVTVLKGTGSLSMQKMWNVIWSVPAAAGTATNVSILHYPILRCIVKFGGTYGGTDAGAFQFIVRHWRDTNVLSPGLK